MSNRNCTIVTIEVKVELTTEVETANAMVIAFTTSFSVSNFPAGPGSWKMGGYGGRRRELQRGHRVRFQDVFGEPTLHRGDFRGDVIRRTGGAAATTADGPRRFEFEGRAARRRRGSTAARGAASSDAAAAAGSVTGAPGRRSPRRRRCPGRRAMPQPTSRRRFEGQGGLRNSKCRHSASVVQ